MSVGPEISDNVCVALVIESTLAVASTWPLIVGEYLTQLLKKLSDNNGGNKGVRLIPFCSVFISSFIAYSTA